MCYLGTHRVRRLLTFLLSCCYCCFCWALRSRVCADIALGAASRRASCPSPVCRAFTLPEDTDPTFLQKLSPQCQSLMARYRTANRYPYNGKLAFGFNSTVRDYQHGDRACPNSRFAMMATNPVVVEAPGALLIRISCCQLANQVCFTDHLRTKACPHLLLKEAVRE